MATKAERVRLARAELLLQLAVTAEKWARQLRDEYGSRPFAEWPADDPLRLLVSTYDLAPADLAKICSQLGDRLEGNAERAGYADRWDAL